MLNGLILVSEYAVLWVTYSKCIYRDAFDEKVNVGFMGLGLLNRDSTGTLGEMLCVPRQLLSPLTPAWRLPGQRYFTLHYFTVLKLNAFIISKLILMIIFLTERRGRMLSTPASYSGGLWL
jgi:hypothetical protein